MGKNYTSDLLDEALKKRGFTWERVKLDIGAGGPSADDSFLSVDLFTDADIVATMWDIPVPDNSIDDIYCANALEHITKFKVVDTLREFNRILRPGGHLLLMVPDLEWACKWWLEHQDTSWNMDCLYGNQSHEGEFHKTGFTKRILFKYFIHAGGMKVVSMDYYGGISELVIRETDETNLLTENVQQKTIVTQAFKVNDWYEDKKFAMGFGKELSTEMTAKGSLDPLFAEGD